MSIEDKLAREAAHAEANINAPFKPGTRVTRGHGRSKTLQVRLNPEELSQIEDLAESEGLPASTLARRLLLDALDDFGRSPRVSSDEQERINAALLSIAPDLARRLSDAG